MNQQRLDDLATIYRRSAKMLDIMRDVHKASKELHKVVANRPNKLPRPEDKKMALLLAARVKKNVNEAITIIEILKAGGAVAFTEVFEMMRHDLVCLERRLENCNVGADVQAIQQDILETLEELAKSLDKG